MFFVLFWQNQLLAKGLLFAEEKIKLCEGKYKAALIERGPCDSAFDVHAAQVLLSHSGRLRGSESPCPFLLRRGQRLGWSQPLVAMQVRTVLLENGVELGGDRLFGDLVKGPFIFFTEHVLGVPLKG